MKERRKQKDRRKAQRRKLLTEAEFRRLIESDKVTKNDKRSWLERRVTKKRKRQLGI